MYEDHFGLNALPFSLSPNTDSFVQLIDFQNCFNLIVYALDSGEGFLKIVGDVGTGKTMLCRRLLRYLSDNQDIRDRFYTVYIANPMLSPLGLYRIIGRELGLELTGNDENSGLLDRINQRILSLAQQERGVVIVVDEAQSLPAQTLEALRLITNLETEQQKLVQIIFFGQLELDELLNRDRFRQLRQRITFSHYLKALDYTQFHQYLNHRLIHHGYNGSSLFDNSALRVLHKKSQGIPRMINVLAHKALLSAYAEQRFQVKKVDVERAWQDNQKDNDNGQHWLLPVIAICFVLALLATIIWSSQ